MFQYKKYAERCERITIDLKIRKHNMGFNSKHEAKKISGRMQVNKPVAPSKKKL